MSEFLKVGKIWPKKVGKTLKNRFFHCTCIHLTVLLVCVQTWEPGGRECSRSSELLWLDQADTPAVCAAANPDWSHCSPPSDGNQHTATCNTVQAYILLYSNFRIKWDSSSVRKCGSFTVCTCNVCLQWKLRPEAPVALPKPPGSPYEGRRWWGTERGVWGGTPRGKNHARYAPLEPAANPTGHLCNLEINLWLGHC